MTSLSLLRSLPENPLRLALPEKALKTLEEKLALIGKNDNKPAES